MSDEQQECQKAKVKMRRLSDEQQECQSTPLLDLAAARLVKRNHIYICTMMIEPIIF